MKSRSFSNLSVRKETLDKVRAFLHYRSVTHFVETAIQEKLQREEEVKNQEEAIIQ